MTPLPYGRLGALGSPSPGCCSLLGPEAGPPLWAFSPFPEVRGEQELPDRMRVLFVGRKGRSAVFLSGRRRGFRVGGGACV